MTMPETCPHCGKQWIDHMGIIGTCRRLQEALTALRVIHTWASFQDGSELVPEYVISLINRTLEK